MNSTPVIHPPKLSQAFPAEELKYFCKFDARHGYWQIPLHPESCPLTCFITPFGRYVCNRAAFGISSISEWYNRRMNKDVNGLHGICKIVDDVLVYASTLFALKKTHLQLSRPMLDAWGHTEAFKVPDSCLQS